jgi:general secretion pathway protein G
MDAIHDRFAPGYTLIELMIAVAIVLTLFAIAAPGYSQALDAAKVTKAVGDLRGTANEILAHRITYGTIPESLADIDRADLRDPYGNPYQYLKFESKGGKGGGPPAGARKDKFLVPINSLYDLYSVGKDGQSQAPLTAQQSWDDIIVANDGGYVGLALYY